MKKQTIIIILLILAIIASGLFIVKGLGIGASDDQNTATETAANADQDANQKPTATKPNDGVSAERKTLTFLIPKSSDKNVGKLVKKYNDTDNRYTLDLVYTETSLDIDPNDYDGLIIPGGKHVHPSCYGAEVECDEHGFNQDLDYLELDLVDAFVSAGKPVLGLCRGSQLVNVALGGTLKQDIGMGHYHDAARDTTIKTGTDFFNMFGGNVETLHYHHQAVDRLADGLVVTMTDTEDGTIEGYVHSTLPIVGYQFHPDRMYNKEDPETVETGRIFMDYFFDLCEREKEKHSQ